MQRVLFGHGVGACQLVEPGLGIERRRHLVGGQGDLPVAEVLAVDRKIVSVTPKLTEDQGNWEIEFFNSERYNAARNHRAP